MKKRTKCYLYTRVSTSMQVDGYSLDAQRDKLRKYAEYEDMIVAGEYSDEGFSGKNIQGRHEFQRMLQDIQDCKDGVERNFLILHIVAGVVQVIEYILHCFGRFAFCLEAALFNLLALTIDRT